MSAPRNNKNSLGNRGGGRKSAYEEARDAEWLKQVWNQDTDVLALQKKIETGRHSLRDQFLAMALAGDVRALKIVADKILPDLDPVAAGGFEDTEIDLIGEAKRRSEKYLR